MPDINKKFVVHYAVRGYASGQTVKITVYDTVGTKEIDNQTMTELGTTGVYYYNWKPRKRTTYVAVCNCPSKPRITHQIIRIEKTKVSGAVSFPKTIIPEPIWKIEEKEIVIEGLKKIDMLKKDPQTKEFSELKKFFEKTVAGTKKELSKLKFQINNIKMDSPKNVSELSKKSVEKINSLSSQITIFVKEINDLKRIADESIVSQMPLTKKFLTPEQDDLLILNKLGDIPRQ